MKKLVIEQKFQGTIGGATPYYKVFAKELTDKWPESIDATVPKDFFDECKVGDIIEDAEFRFTTQLKKSSYGEYRVQKLKITGWKLKSGTTTSTIPGAVAQPSPSPDASISDPDGIRFA